MKTDARVEREIEHSKKLKDSWEGAYYYWETPAGKKRYERRLAMISSHITPEMSVLEIGCGTGCFTLQFAETKAHITAIDVSPDFLDIARKKVIASNVSFKIDNAYALSFEDSSFDTIVGSSVLHHLDIDQALKEFLRVLKPGGTIFFAEPNMLNPQIFIERNVGFVKSYLHVSPDETAFVRGPLRKKIFQYGFEDVTVAPFDFLHPLIFPPLVPFFQCFSLCIEKVPLLKEIAGSLFIQAKKPSQ
ncbi:MAG: methyltransferase domain-containing protein [Candidatus Omnitrophica bacterium]|nr:methyltransferase domain-containing protein [Candidatus Omnitrophota bacterium]